MTKATSFPKEQQAAKVKKGKKEKLLQDDGENRHKQNRGSFQGEEVEQGKRKEKVADKTKHSGKGWKTR